MLWNCCVGEDSESPLDCKKIQPVHPKGDQSWVFIGRTYIEAEMPILWLPIDVKNWLVWKDPDAGKDWRWEEKGTTEDELVGWHHKLNGHGFGWTPVVGDGQGGLVCCDSWGHKESDTTEWLNWTELNWPRLLSCYSSTLSLDVGYLFLVSSLILLSMVVQQLIAVLVFSQVEVSSCPSPLPSWTRLLEFSFYPFLCLCLIFLALLMQCHRVGHD